MWVWDARRTEVRRSGAGLVDMAKLAHGARRATIEAGACLRGGNEDARGMECSAETERALRSEKELFK